MSKKPEKNYPLDSCGRYTCQKCDYRAVHETSVERHLILFHPEPKNRTFACPLCEFKANLHSTLKYHLYSRHGGVRHYRCEKCTFTSVTPFNLKRHIATEHPEDRKGNMLEDILLKGQTNKPRFSCPHCDYQSKHIPSVKRHITVTHGKRVYVSMSDNEDTDESPMEEAPTDEASTDDSHPSPSREPEPEHIDTNPFKCDKCSFSCLKSIHLKKHLAEIHDEGAIYACGGGGFTCYFKTQHAASLKRHIQTKHYKVSKRTDEEMSSDGSDSESSNAKGAEKTKQQKINRCYYCDFKTPYPSWLKKHVESKHSPVTYQCTRCTYAAPTERQLINHFKAENHFF